MRLQGVPPASIVPDEDLVVSALQRRGARSRVQFLHVGLQRSLAWYDARITDADDPHHALWQTLRGQQASVADDLKALIAQIEAPQE